MKNPRGFFSVFKRHWISTVLLVASGCCVLPVLSRLHAEKRAKSMYQIFSRLSALVRTSGKKINDYSEFIEFIKERDPALVFTNSYSEVDVILFRPGDKYYVHTDNNTDGDIALIIPKKGRGLPAIYMKWDGQLYSSLMFWK